MKKKVSLVLVPIDDFTDEIITKEKVNIEVMNEYIKPIRKSDGFIILTDLSKDNVDIKISSYFYNDVKMNINISKINKLNPVIKIRLKPGKYYRFNKSITCLSGTAINNSKLMVIVNNKENVFRLLEDNEKNKDVIKIYNPLKLDIEGQSFIIRKKGSRVHEKFSVIRYDELNESVIMDNLLNKSYKKESCEIIKVDCIDINDDGSFFVPLKNITETENQIKIETDNKKIYNIKLIAGRINEVIIDE